LSEISNDLILAQSMPSGAVHTNTSVLARLAARMVLRWAAIASDCESKCALLELSRDRAKT
jgi:hypothetical protein